MKKLIFSIFLAATFAIHVNATEPMDKLPAIVIDTIYVSKEALVVEYEVIRQFDHISMSVRSSWSQTINGVNPILLSGRVGKGKTNVPISLATDDAVHFNVFIAGHQFVNKGDSAEYETNTYDYAIFKKQNDNTVKQYRTRYTEDEKIQITERRKDINNTRRFIDGNTSMLNFSDSTRKSTNESYVDPLAVDIYELVELPIHKDDSINKPQRGAVKDYTFSISGYVKTDPINSWSTYIPKTDVFLIFRNSNNPSVKYYYPIHNDQYEEGIHYVTTDGTGNFSFNCSITADLSYVDQVVIFVAHNNEYVYLNVAGDYIDYPHFRVPVFLPHSSSIFTIDHNSYLPGVQETNQEIIVSNIVLGGSLGMFWYAGELTKKLLDSPLQWINVFETNASYLGQFNCGFFYNPYINLSGNKTITSYRVLGTPAHEYGHFLHYVLWNFNCNKWGNSSDETAESFAMFYSYATRHYAYKNGFGLTHPPGVNANNALIRDEMNNFDIAPFTTPKFNITTSYPHCVPWASYLWNLFDGHPNFQGVNSDNDDIAMPKRVIQTFASISDISTFHNTFKNGLTDAEKASVDGIYDFTVGNQTTGMRSQNFHTSSMSVSSNNLSVSFTYQPYQMADHLGNNIRNLPTSFRLYCQQFTNCPWLLISEIPYVEGQTSYSQVINFGATASQYNYRLTVNNASGASAYPYFRTYHNNSGACQQRLIEGPPGTVCYAGSSFALFPPLSNITWTVTGSFSFSPTSTVTSSTAVMPIVYRRGSIANSGTLSALTNGINGQEVAQKTINPCLISIIGVSAAIVGAAHTFEVSNDAPAGFTWDHSSHFTPVQGTPGRFTATSTGNGWVRIMFNGEEIAKHNVTISPAPPPSPIIGNPLICNSGYFTISTGQAIDWQVTDGFVIIDSGSTWVQVGTFPYGSYYGTLTVYLSSGVSSFIPIQKSTANLNCLFPGTKFVYMTNLSCGAYVKLVPYPDYPFAEYTWDLIFSCPRAYVSLPSYKSSYLEIWFPSEDCAVRLDAYLYEPNSKTLSPHPTIEYRIYAGCSGRSPANDFTDIESDVSPVKVFPNPASDILTVEFEDSSLARSGSAYNVNLFDSQANLVRQQRSTGGAVEFNVGNLPTGVYFLYIFDNVNDKLEVKQVVITR